MSPYIVGPEKKTLSFEELQQIVKSDYISGSKQYISFQLFDEIIVTSYIVPIDWWDEFETQFRYSNDLNNVVMCPMSGSELLEDDNHSLETNLEIDWNIKAIPESV